VFSNLINNATKFTQHGKITIRIFCEDLATITFCVRDTGIGIKKEDLPKLFQKYQQVGDAGNYVRGTGLGLTICKDIVEKHGGRIWVESTLGKGTSFFFLVPVTKSRRILIADEDRASVELICNVLKKTDNYDIKTVYNASQVHLQYGQFLPHLTILNTGMSRLNGYKLCSLIKRDKKNKDARVFMVVSSNDGLQLKSFEAGADAILRKPVDPMDLILKVRKFI
jgi:CheY-like chemotaxis protein